MHVHERTNVRHKGKTAAKYLENAVKENPFDKLVLRMFDLRKASR